jgi:hypothetical protein
MVADNHPRVEALVAKIEKRGGRQKKEKRGDVETGIMGAWAEEKGVEKDQSGEKEERPSWSEKWKEEWRQWKISS